MCADAADILLRPEFRGQAAECRIFALWCDRLASSALPPDQAHERIGQLSVALTEMPGDRTFTDAEGLG